MPSGGLERAARFEAFASRFGKEYANAAERFHRASLFSATEKFVNAMNRRRLPYWLEVNFMADWTAEEKHKLLGRAHTPKGTVVPATATHEPSEKELPDEIDWRLEGAVTPPKDQGAPGSPRQISLS